MKARELFDGCGLSGYDENTEILHITSDSRRVETGSLFICLRGIHRDGHDYAAEAAERGAVLILAEKPVSGVPEKKLLLTENTRAAEARIWNNFTSRPADGMKKIAVTGTAGKTTVACILAHIFRCAGYRVGMITTVKTLCADRELNLGEHGGSSVADLCGAMTTPDPEYFFTACAEMKKDGCEVLIYEASSQALALSKLDPLTNDAAIFTNLSAEHLDFHGDRENYFAAKASLMKRTKCAIVNFDDEYMGRLGVMFPDVKTVLCSADASNAALADVCALRYASHGGDGVEYVYFSERAVFRIKSSMIGRYTVMNTMQAAACAVHLGVSLMTVKEAIEEFRGAEGRMMRCEKHELCPEVIIDYAHTPQSLASALEAVREISDGRRVVVLFGCGGDRDRTKRPMMAEKAQKYADFVIITSDNPRYEDPDCIIDDILSGIDTSKPYCVIKDRREAIGYALSVFGEESIVLLAGKGHEKYEICGGEKKPFDEEAIVSEAAAEKQMKYRNNH